MREVVRAYRLLLERIVDESGGDVAPRDVTVNTGSGRSVTIEDVLRKVCSAAGVGARWHVDPGELRPVDMLGRFAETARRKALTGWAPTILLDASLLDILATTST